MRALVTAVFVCILLPGGGSLLAQQGSAASGQPTSDSSYTGPRYDLGAGPDMEIGSANVPPVPPGMLMRAAPENPAMVYFALYHRTGAGIAPADVTIIDGRQADLVRAAAYRGYDLKQAGWMYQQAICPATQAEADAMNGGGEGSILLHFVRHEGDRISSFTAVVPRDEDRPVRTIPITHNSVEQREAFLSADTTGAVVNVALPPAALYQNLEPNADWIATGACIAEMGGAYPHIPNEPSLSNALLRAPAPYLRLGVHGEREVLFADRVDATHYVVWDENVSAHGRMQGAHREYKMTQSAAILHPKQPPMHTRGEGAPPPMVTKPYPPGPVPGLDQ